MSDEFWAYILRESARTNQRETWRRLLRWLAPLGAAFVAYRLMAAGDIPGVLVLIVTVVVMTWLDRVP